MQTSLGLPTPGNPANMHNFSSDAFCAQGSAVPLDRDGFREVIDQTLITDTCPLSYTADTLPTGGSTGHSSAPSTAAAHRLAKLNIALYGCAAKLPSTPEADAETVGSTSLRRDSREQGLFAIDELFRLTSEFINIIQFPSTEPCAMSIGSPTTPPEPSSTQVPSLFTLSQKRASTGLEDTDFGPRSSLSQLDEGTLLMLLSCHCRLTETYLSIFRMMQACIQYSLPPTVDKDFALILPQLQVGSLSSPSMQVNINTPVSPATSSMYMVMITMLSSQLCETLASLLLVEQEEMSSGGRGNVSRGQGLDRVDQSPTSPFQLLFMATVTDRTHRLRDSIDTTKLLLQTYPVVAA